MKLRFDLVVPALLIATAGAYSATPDAVVAKPAAQACHHVAKLAEPEAVARIAAEGYSEVRMLGVGCDSAWHAVALAEGDPVILKVTPQGAVVTE